MRSFAQRDGGSGPLHDRQEEQLDFVKSEGRRPFFCAKYCICYCHVLNTLAGTDTKWGIVYMKNMYYYSEFDARCSFPTSKVRCDMEFFGDSDCDENPFAPTDENKDLHRHSSVDTIGKLSLEDGQEQEHTADQTSLSSLRKNAGATSSTTDAAAPGEAGTASGARQGHSNRNSYRVGDLPKGVATGHPSTVFPRGLRWQAFPSTVPTAFESQPAFIPAFSATAGSNVEGNNLVADRLAALPVIGSIGSEVETETEGETETEDGGESGSDEEEGHRDVAHRRSTINKIGSSRNNAYNGSGGNTTSSGSPATAGEEEHIALIDAELNNAHAGKPDPHAMRLLLRKIGYVPPSRRKDIWRLLILGRVEATGVRPSVGAGGGTRYSYTYPSDMIALEAAILSTDLDLDNQRVVRVDVERTRPALEQFKRPRVRNLLTRVLTHHCKANGLGYKQVCARRSCLSRVHSSVFRCHLLSGEESGARTWAPGSWIGAGILTGKIFRPIRASEHTKMRQPFTDQMRETSGI